MVNILKRKIKWNNIICLIMGFCFTLGLLFASVKISIRILDYHHVEKINEEISNISNVVETIQNFNINETTVNNNSESLNTMQKLLQADFNELKKMNPDTIGWITVNGTQIHYPFVQTDNNDFYLNHSFDKKKNGAGWIFLDYRNVLTKSNRNLILYAHGGSSKALFGDLKNIMSNGWFQDSQNFFIKTSTPFENNLWEVFSIYQIPTTSDYLQIHFANDQEFMNFASNLKNRSKFLFSTSIDSEDSILTLSTCANDNEKIVLHAKLVQTMKRD